MNELWPWARALSWRAPQQGEIRLRLSADAVQRTTIARDLDLVTLDRLNAELTARAWLDGMEIVGRLSAAFVQTCGVTLEPFLTELDEPVHFRFVPEGSPHAVNSDGSEVIIDLEAEDPPDVVAGEEVAVCDYVIEALALLIDPFPRKPGAVFVAPEEPVSLSPFAALAALAKPSQRD